MLLFLLRVSKCFSQTLYGIFSNFFLNMQVMLCHVHFGMTTETLDGGNIHTQRLKHGNIGVPTTMGRQDAYTNDTLDGFFELILKVGGIT